MPDSLTQRAAWPLVLLTALSLSIGWGIRGNFGHEFGAMIAGALAAMAAVLMSSRGDWHRRLPYFAMFGALGWSFGGSMSYMQVVAYTHSGHALSVLYGFACLFVIGFLWAAPGGAGTALAAIADRERLTELFAPLSAVFLAWFVQRVVLVPWLVARKYDLNWFDTDWMAATTAPAGVLVLAAIRRRLDRGTGLVLALSAGWWAGFGLLVVLLGFRMTPPRGDNWAGCLGMTLAMFGYCLRTGLQGVALGGLIAGIVGGVSFASACMLKLVEVTCGLESNWHSIMEQTTGLIHGLGIAGAMIFLARRAGPVEDEPRSRRWTEVYAVGFVLLGITYLNLRKNPGEWVKSGAMPEVLAGIPAVNWFDLGYLLLAIAVLVPLAAHLRGRLPLLSMGALGQGQWLYLAFLWWMVVGNFERALVGFRPQRLVTEGVIFANAAFCTLLMLLGSGRGPASRGEAGYDYRPALRKGLAVGVIVAAVTILADWAIVRAIYGDRFAGHANLHIRFGPEATTNRPDSPR
jgi:hypothetical protein